MRGNLIAWRRAGVADALGSRARIEATTDRRRAVDGADDVVTMMQVGGYRPATVTDFEVPKRYGLRQTIGDTLGVGGIMRAPRRPGRARRQPRARLPRGDAHPHTAAELSLEEIRRLVDDLLDAHGELIPEST